MAITAGYGVIGYVDDYLKLKHRKSGGLKGRCKIFWQVTIATVVMAYVFAAKSNLPEDWLETRDNLSVPFLAFSKHPFVVPAYLYIPFAVLVIVAWSNAVNLTDGLDGLAIGPVMVSSGTFLIWSYIAGTTFLFKVGPKMVTLPVYLDIAPNASGGELSVYCGAVVGAGIGFLWYNTYPAQVFMGDVGSLSLGGGLGTLSVFTKNELLSILLGGVFFVETLSVITQVVSFKLTGKRVFLMAPIHHHFEKKGWYESQVVMRFYVMGVLCAVVALSTLKLR
jgi:phospho-N-acetylmuramoyl-pentapeptide-transferase